MNNQVFEISLCGVMVLLIFKLQKMWVMQYESIISNQCESKSEPSQREKKVRKNNVYGVS